MQASTSQSDKKTLLIVDDDGPILRALTARFEHAKFNVKPATNASLALAQLDDIAPDAAILDINMPGLDGFKLADELKKRAPSCECVFLSASKSQDHAKQAAERNLKIVEKPFDASELLSIVENACQRH